MIKERFIEQYGLAAVHDRLRRVGRLDPAAPDRPQLPGPARRPHAGHLLSGHRLESCRDVRRLRPPPNTTSTRSPEPRELARRLGAPKVEGYAPTTDGRTNCDGWAGFANQWQNPVAGFDPVVPCRAALRSGDATPRAFARTFWDGQVNVFGVDNQTGFARSAVRQYRNPVRPQRAERRGHHDRGVPRPQREDRRPRHRRPHRAAAERGRPEGHRERLPHRAGGDVGREPHPAHHRHARTIATSRRTSTRASARSRSSSVYRRPTERRRTRSTG